MQVSSFVGSQVAHASFSDTRASVTHNNLNQFPGVSIYYPQNGQSPEAEAIDLISGRLYEMLTDRNDPPYTIVGRVWDLLAGVFTSSQAKEQDENSADRKKRNTEQRWTSHVRCDEEGLNCITKATAIMYSDPDWEFYVFKTLPLPASPTTYFPVCTYNYYTVNAGNEPETSFEIKLMMSDCGFSSQQQRCIAETLGFLSPYSEELVDRNIFELNATDPIYSFAVSGPSEILNATWDVKMRFMHNGKFSFTKDFINKTAQKISALGGGCEKKVVKTQEQIFYSALGLGSAILGIAGLSVCLYRKRSAQNLENDESVPLTQTSVTSYDSLK